MASLLINQLVRLAESVTRFNFSKAYLAGCLSEAEFDPLVARSEKEHRGRRAGQSRNKPPVHQLSLAKLIVIPVCAVAGPLTPLPRARPVIVAAEQGLLMQVR